MLRAASRLTYTRGRPRREAIVRATVSVNITLFNKGKVNNGGYSSRAGNIGYFMWAYCLILYNGTMTIYLRTYMYV